MIQLDLAERKRDEGIARAQRHAGDPWTEFAVNLVRRYASEHPQFLTEDFVDWTRGLIAEPPDGRAWGAVMRIAARKGLVRKVGYAPARTSNLSPKCVWSAAADRLEQLEAGGSE